MIDLADADLIQATKEGKTDAYAVLVDRYASDIFAISMGIIANVDDARDISQDAFLRGFTKIG
ncbi:MAG: RNA polymerase sigma factor, partial [Candidatus Krumholzibacteria bacterium]|nr:RNA polymerase sigma factor [Candidatus Krumholzibacteria bacterium]